MTTRMGAYHDGELDPPTRESIERHLAMCDQCRGELAHLRGMSSLFSSARVDGLSADELRAVRRRAEALAERPPLQLFGGMMAAAASILIVCGAWWHEMPRSNAASSPGYAAYSAAPEWERLAVNLRFEPSAASPQDDTAVADAQLADWMLAGL